MMVSRTRYQSGFSLIEVGIVIPMLIVIAMGLFVIMENMITSSTLERLRINSTYDRQVANDAIEKDSLLVSAFLPTTDAGLTDDFKPTSNGNTWSYLGDSTTSRALIMRAYSTTNHPLSSTRTPTYIGNPAAPACAGADRYLNNVQQYNIIYFLKYGNLYRRLLVDTATQTCTAQYQQTSCPSLDDLPNGTNRGTCSVDDELIAKNVSKFEVTYYANKSTTPLDVYAVGADPALVLTATDADIALTIDRSIPNHPVQSDSTLRISKLNNIPKAE